MEVSERVTGDWEKNCHTPLSSAGSDLAAARQRHGVVRRFQGIEQDAVRPRFEAWNHGEFDVEFCLNRNNNTRGWFKR